MTFFPLLILRWREGKEEGEEGEGERGGGEREERRSPGTDK